jgi:hypothetical protein
MGAGILIAADNPGSVLDGLCRGAQPGESARSKEGCLCAIEDVVIGGVAGLANGGHGVLASD